MEDKDREDIEVDIMRILRAIYCHHKIGNFRDGKEQHIAGKIAEYIIKNYDKKPRLNIPG